jgi:GNAT superfamily N-acetyltransferase/predicted nucleotidyltransferase
MNIVVYNEIAKFKDDLYKLFGDKLIDIVIYGSVIRGGFNPKTSDIDFIVILNHKLIQSDLNKIIELHEKYRNETTLISLLEGRYIGIQNDEFANGYYVGTSRKGWRTLSKIGFDNIEAAMILDNYKSLYNKHTIVKLLHFTWGGIVEEIRNQVMEFINSPLIGVNEKYTRYALITASRSLYTYLHAGFISKDEVITWINYNHLRIDFNHPKIFLMKVQAFVSEVHHIKSEDSIDLIWEYMLNTLEFKNKDDMFLSSKRLEIVNQFYRNPELILYIEACDKIIASLTMSHNNDDEIKIGMMAVNKDYRGLGYGRLLISHAEKLAKKYNYKRIILGSRLSAISFYSKMGYKPLIMIQDLSFKDLEKINKINEENYRFPEINRFFSGDTYSVFFDPIHARAEYAVPFQQVVNADVEYVFSKELK